MRLEDIINKKITGETHPMARITSVEPVEPIDPFNKTKTTEEALEDEYSDNEEKFDLDNNSCEICGKSINNGGYVLQKSENNNNFYFCSSKCINDFKNKGYSLNEYQLFKISRCASYHCCSEIGNLRRMCEKTKSLTNYSLLDSFSPVNFCEPATAGQIKASYAIYKHLQKVDAENEKLSAENTKLNKRTQFLTIVSTVMALITIILSGITVIKSFIDKPIEYKQELESIQNTLQVEKEDTEAIKINSKKIETAIETMILSTTNIENEESEKE